MNRVFPIAEQNYILGNNSNFVTRRIHTVHYESESLSLLGPKLWRISPDEYKPFSSLKEFKSNIKTWVPNNYPCHLCKRYVQHVGFI